MCRVVARVVWFSRRGHARWSAAFVQHSFVEREAGILHLSLSLSRDSFPSFASLWLTRICSYYTGAA